MVKNKTKVLTKKFPSAEFILKFYTSTSFDSLLSPHSSPTPFIPATPPHTSTCCWPQWNLSAGPQAAGHLLSAAPVPEGDQRRQRPHRREQPALLLQHRQLDATLPHLQPKGPDPQQPEPKAVLWVFGARCASFQNTRLRCLVLEVLFRSEVWP